MFSLRRKGRALTKPSFMNKQSVDSNRPSTDSASSSDGSSMLSSQTLVASPAPKGLGPTPTDYAEMLEDENMSWGPPKSRRC